MRALIQRVNQASVEVDGSTISSIQSGLLVLLGCGKGDTTSQLEPLAKKIANLRIFADDSGRSNRSLLDVAGSALVVSQFTLYADTSRGNRPGFSEALEPEAAKQLYLDFMQALKGLGVSEVRGGEFGAYMKVKLENDGPVTISLEI